jgi:hypothetical protein
MELSTNSKNVLVKEIRTAAEYMGKANSVQQKMYFFSAVFGIANRLMNLEFDSELGFIHHVTNAAYNNINTNLVLMSQGQAVPTIPAPVFDKLQRSLYDLAGYIEEGKPTYPVLERISNLAYSTSGNGYYLFLKGLLKLD